MSFLGIIGSRFSNIPLSSFSHEPSFRLFITIGLATFCGIAPTHWRGNDNEVELMGVPRLIPSAD